ncbi:MAG: 2Fe-2S iron-sulfur cluster-binding protein [Dehalococcoidia bacterium]|nr:2Fe-2S iron-sulfur cluster-binding protein [Dehalococcoidia bacterium]
MSEKERGGLSRREFLKDAGLVVGGATVGSMAFLGACGGDPPTTTVIQEKNVYVCPFDDTSFASLSLLQDHMAHAHPNANNLKLVAFNINGTESACYVRDTETLATVIRERFGLFGTKVPCNMGVCGGCTVLVDDLPVYSCLMLGIECGGKRITTVEGLSSVANVETAIGTGAADSLSSVQRRFYEQDAFQCGFCTPGFLMAGAGLLKVNSNPSYEEARMAVSGHICMCGNIKKVVDALTGNGGVV